MDGPNDTWLIGVDGGGTTCRVALVSDGRRFEVTLGAANAALDRDGAIATVISGIRQLHAQAGLDGHAMNGARAHVALAGILSAAEGRAVAARLKKGLGMRHVSVSEDQVAMVTGALGDGDGAVVGIGTGSFLARQSGGTMRRIGGWGLVLGDDASGAWLGRGLLAATLQAQDGLLAGSRLCDAMLRRFGDAPGISAFAATASPAGFGALAPLIAASAQNGDAVAGRLMRDGAGYILRGLAALGRARGEKVILTGGMGSAFEPWLTQDVRTDVCPPLGSALDGALQLAARMETAA